MARDLRTSDRLESFLDTIRWEYDQGLTPEERLQAKKDRLFVKVIVTDIIKSRESLTDNKLRVIEDLVKDDPELIEELLDDYFSRELVGDVPGCVDRVMQLSRLEASRIPSDITNGYLKEAVRTYVMGLPQACIALCRAALEQSLKENMTYQSKGHFVELRKLIDEAETAGVLDATTRRIAKDIARDANNVLHEKPTDLKKAKQMLIALRGVLQHVYSE